MKFSFCFQLQANSSNLEKIEITSEALSLSLTFFLESLHYVKVTDRIPKLRKERVNGHKLEVTEFSTEE